MITVNIPSRQKLEAEHLVLDVNGTLANDGKIDLETINLLKLLESKIAIHVVTADTYGTARNELKDINCKIKILSSGQQDKQKKKYVNKLGKDHTIAIGNGLNDALMLKTASLSIGVIQMEGASMKCLIHADVVCTNINHALELLLNPMRLIATLRT